METIFKLTFLSLANIFSDFGYSIYGTEKNAHHWQQRAAQAVSIYDIMSHFFLADRQYNKY